LQGSKPAPAIQSAPWRLVPTDTGRAFMSFSDVLPPAHQLVALRRVVDDRPVYLSLVWVHAQVVRREGRTRADHSHLVVIDGTRVLTDCYRYSDRSSSFESG